MQLLFTLCAAVRSVDWAVFCSDGKWGGWRLASSARKGSPRLALSLDSKIIESLPRKIRTSPIYAVFNGLKLLEKSVFLFFSINTRIKQTAKIFSFHL
ncbi:MAG: hypothetical protein C0508_05405 [Cyanobacteria bacterium PR.023]|nr:hypothetical protein [Cyanobacteria bacterium PR.023]